MPESNRPDVRSDSAVTTTKRSHGPIFQKNFGLLRVGLEPTILTRTDINADQTLIAKTRRWSFGLDVSFFAVDPLSVVGHRQDHFGAYSFKVCLLFAELILASSKVVWVVFRH